MKRGCMAAFFSIALTFSMSLNVFADSVLSGGIAGISAGGISSPLAGGSAASNGDALGNPASSDSAAVKQDSSWEGYADPAITGAEDSFVNGNYASMSPSQKEAVQNAISEFKKKYITGDMGEFEREMLIIQWLVENCSYDKTTDNCATAYGAIVEGKAKCAGYADAFLQMAKACGLEARYIYLRGVHAWNLVKIDGDWYHVDVTFEDPVNGYEYGFGNLRNQYINLEDAEIANRASHVDWEPKTIQATGIKYGPAVVEKYLATGEIDVSEAVSYRERTEELFADYSAERGGITVYFENVDQAVNEICSYMESRINSRAKDYKILIRYPDSYNKNTKGKYMEIFHDCQQMQPMLIERIEDAYYPEVLRSKPAISLFRDSDADFVYYVHIDGNLYYQE